MKKQLLIGSALLAAMSAFPQAGRVSGGSAGAVNHKTEQLPADAGINEDLLSPMPGSGVMAPVANEPQAQSKAVTSVNWGLLTGSSNCYGQLVSSQRPLSYNPELGAVAFIHRKSDHYLESPALPSTAKTGVILANVSTDWGTTWDSTAIWSNATNWGRYPQGGIYNPTNNTSISNAYVLGTGPTVAGTVWSGVYYTSKKLNTFDATASTAPGAQYFFDLAAASYPAGEFSHGWTRNGFTATLDGKMHAVGITSPDLQTLANVRGFAVLTGSFNSTSNTFDWKMDSLVPPVLSNGAGVRYLNPDPVMVWNREGTVGYIIGIGVLSSGTLATRGQQPIIYKYDSRTNANATWTLQNGIDFNAANMRKVIISKFDGTFGMGPLQIMNDGDTVGVPFFNDFDCAVDGNNNLHIGATFYGHSNDHPDSLNFLQTFTTSINPTERYSWRMINGSRPYLWDFYGDGISFTPLLIDSIASEGPSPASGQRGYNENPWDPSGTGSAKIGIDSRIQLGRSVDGKQIVFTWVESDSLFTNQQFKWNALPDIKTRAVAVHSGTNLAKYVVDLGPEQNLTKDDNNVRTRATLHYMSNTVTNASLTCFIAATQYSADIRVPLTVTNSNPFSQLTNNATWFGAANVNFRFPKASGESIGTPLIDGIAEIGGAVSYVSIFPNPAQNAAAVKFSLANSGVVEVVVMNAVGQVVKTTKVQGTVGENAVRIDLSGIASGIYMVNVKAGESQTTKKLIVE